LTAVATGKVPVRPADGERQPWIAERVAYSLPSVFGPIERSRERQDAVAQDLGRAASSPFTSSIVCPMLDS